MDTGYLRTISLFSSWNHGGCRREEEEEGSCYARNPQEKVKVFLRAEVQVFQKVVCRKDGLKGKMEAHL